MKNSQATWLRYHYTAPNDDWAQWSIYLPETGNLINLTLQSNQTHLTHKILWHTLTQADMIHLARTGAGKALVYQINTVTDNLSRFLRTQLADYEELVGEGFHAVEFDAQPKKEPSLTLQLHEASEPLKMTLSSLPNYEVFKKEFKDESVPVKTQRKIYVTARRILQGYPAALRKSTPLRGLRFNSWQERVREVK